MPAAPFPSGPDAVRASVCCYHQHERLVGPRQGHPLQDGQSYVDRAAEPAWRLTHAPDGRARRLGAHAAEFVPTPTAASFQLSNPSALAVTSLLGSLQVFDMTSMEALRAKSLQLTALLEQLLLTRIQSEYVGLRPQRVPRTQSPACLTLPKSLLSRPLQEPLERAADAADAG